MKLIHINPKAKTVTAVAGDDPNQLARDLVKGGIDHDSVAPGIGIIVWEFGLLEGNGPYFAMGGKLFSGDAILFGFDEAGDTIDAPDPPTLIWFANREEVEQAIFAGVVERPFSAVNGEIIWQWR